MVIIRKGFLEEVVLELTFEKRRRIFLMNIVGRAFQIKAKAKIYIITWYDWTVLYLFHSWRMQFYEETVRNEGGEIHRCLIKEKKKHLMP